jgi:hypothetical protein
MCIWIGRDADRVRCETSQRNAHIVEQGAPGARGSWQGGVCFRPAIPSRQSPLRACCAMRGHAIRSCFHSRQQGFSTTPCSEALCMCPQQICHCLLIIDASLFRHYRGLQNHV